MSVKGQATTKNVVPNCEDTPKGSGGFIMVALLVSMAVTAVWMTALLPSWKQQVRRQQEAELTFRGEAISNAIFRYWQKNGNTFPPSLDVLVAQKFLRKKYKDPITGKDFLPLMGGAGTGRGGIVGVRSTSNEQSIRIYNNQQTYSQFGFDYTLAQLLAGQAVGPGGGVAPGKGRGGAGAGRGGPGVGGPGTGGANGANGPGAAPRGGGGGGELNPISPGRGGARGGAQAPPFGIAPPSGGRIIGQ